MFLFSLPFLILSIIQGQGHWFQRSGAFYIVAGTILSLRKLVRQGIYSFIEDENTSDGGHYIPTKEDINRDNEQKKDVWALTIGLVLMCLGTLISAFGDLLFHK